MNDFSELENELKKLRPAQPSPVLFRRVEQALKDCGTGALAGTTPVRRPYNWWWLGCGLATTGIVVLFAVISFEREHRLDTATVAQRSPASEMRPEAPGTEQSRVTGRFVPAGNCSVFLAGNSCNEVRRPYDRPVVRGQFSRSTKQGEQET